MNRTLEHYLAIVTIAMTIILPLAHFMRALAKRIREHAATTASKTDDVVAERLYNIAMWIDVVVIFIAGAVSGGLSRPLASRRARTPPPAAPTEDPQA